jgi:hypothetical protein
MAVLQTSRNAYILPWLLRFRISLRLAIRPSAKAVIRLKPEAGGVRLKETDTITFAPSFSPQASSRCM